ncbi:MAG: SDR family oxidoreductase [Flavobacteriales bacterium]
MSFFQNKVAWITGASSGIGEALALELNKQGAKIILSSRKKEELEKVKQKCSHPENVFILPLDLEKSELIPDITKSALSAFGYIDLLFNNGGLSQRSNAIDTSEEVDRKIMEINYFGNIALSKSLLPHFRSRKSGYIIVTSSISGKFGFYLRSAYSASKHALHGFYESLRLEEEGNGLKVLMICPGKVATDISMNALTGSGSQYHKMDKATQDGISAYQCASEILKALQKNKEEVFIGGREVKAVKLKRFFPKWFGKIIRRQSRA